MANYVERILENEMVLAKRYVFKHIFFAILIFCGFVVFGYPVETAVWGGKSPAQWLAGTIRYFELMAEDWEPLAAQYDASLTYWQSRWGFLPPSWCVGLFFALVNLILQLRENPFQFIDTSQGSARFARYIDVVRSGLFDQTGIILGRWEDTHKLIRNWETTSAALIAPPGTAKTVQLISNLLGDWPDQVKVRKKIGPFPLPWTAKDKAPVPAPCIVVNDPKGEMYDVTSGWRSTQGPVVRIAWGDPGNSARWNPISPRSYPGGEECLRLRAELLVSLGDLYEDPADTLRQILVLLRQSNWLQVLKENPAGLGYVKGDDEAVASKLEGMAAKFMSLQSLMSEREKHIDRLNTILIPDSIEAHWRNTGREFGAGAIGFYMAQCERLGVEPNMGGLLDWLNGSTNGAATASEFDMVETGEIGSDGKPQRVARAPTGVQTGGGGGDDDMIATMLKAAVAEAEGYGYPPRVIQDLNATLMKPDKERGSVVSTFGAGVNIFKNASVRAVTSTSDFPLSACRGIKDESGFLRPVTFYVVVSLEDAEMYGRITGLFLETMASFAISQPESAFKKPWKTGQMVGRPLLFILDEFWTLPPLQALLQIPALGRGQWVSMILVGQSYGQIGAKYRQSGGSDTIDTLKAATNYKMIPTQNDFKTAKEVSESIGNRTITTKSQSRQNFDIGAMFDPNGGKGGGGSESEQRQARPLMPPENIMSMEKLDPNKGHYGWQIVQLAGSMNRPVYCRPSCWFVHPEQKLRAGLPLKIWAPYSEPGPARNDNHVQKKGAEELSDKKTDDGADGGMMNLITGLQIFSISTPTDGTSPTINLTIVPGIEALYGRKQVTLTHFGDFMEIMSGKDVIGRLVDDQGRLGILMNFRTSRIDIVDDAGVAAHGQIPAIIKVAETRKLGIGR